MRDGKEVGGRQNVVKDFEGQCQLENVKKSNTEIGNFDSI